MTDQPRVANTQEPPDQYYRALGRIVAASSRMELAVLQLCLAIDIGLERSALIDHLPDYSRPGMVRRYARRVVGGVQDSDQRRELEEYLDHVELLIRDRHAATHGIAAFGVAIGDRLDGAGEDEQEDEGIWFIFDPGAKSVRQMSLVEMSRLSDSLIAAETEGKRLRDIIAPPPDRTAAAERLREYLRRRKAGESTEDLMASLDAPPTNAARHEWRFEGPVN